MEKNAVTSSGSKESNAVRVHQLKSELAACRQEGESVEVYFRKLSEKWEELLSYKPFPKCTCGALEEFRREHEEEHVHQFLMGLDDNRFGSVRSNIICMDPLPDLNTIYQLVIKEERLLNSSKHKLSIAGVTRTRDNNRSVVCSHCGRRGHEMKDCWHIVGHPEGQNGHNRSRGGGTRGRGRGRGPSYVSNVAIATSSRPSLPCLTPEQLASLTNLLVLQNRTPIVDTSVPHHITDLNRSEAKGGCGGQEWDDGRNHEGISQIYIREGNQGIESIKFDYVENGKPKAGATHGGSSQGFTEWFDLNHTCDEHILYVKCYYDEGAIQGLKIKTNIRASAVMGYILGTTFKLEMKGKKIIGFHGSSNNNLRSLGAYFAPLSPTNLRR